jgi:hypothetical protein
MALMQYPKQSEVSLRGGSDQKSLSPNDGCTFGALDVS